MFQLKRLPKPDLDDKTFAQLVDEAVNLIPRYSESWTDHNLSDPGITLIDLFAWLTETSLYRLNLITDRHRLKYLKLLGCRPNPPMPASVDLNLKSPAARHLDAGTVVHTKLADRQIFYELSEDLNISKSSLQKVVVDEMNGGVFDRTDSNGKADMFFAPFGLSVRRDCAMYLGLSESSENLDLACRLYEKDLILPGSHGGEPDYEFENAKFRWEVLTSRGWSEVIIKSDGTGGFRKSGRLRFEGIDAEAWISSEDIAIWKEPGRPYYWLRCVVEESNMEYPPRLETIMLNTVHASEGRTYLNDSQWKGNGLPDQPFKLSHFPVADKTLEIAVNGIIAQEQDDLEGSGPEDYHFVLDRDKGVLRFGDGITGKVPPAGCSLNAIRYRTCLGSEGMVPAGSEWKIEGMDDLTISNDSASTGGIDGESVEEAAFCFVRDLRLPYTTVTSADFEYITVNTPGLRIARAKAIPNYHPDDGKTPGLVTVVVLPFTPLDFFEDPPNPSDGLKQAVCRHLNHHRLIGTGLYITGPHYVRVTVALTVVLSGASRQETVVSAIREKLNKYIHPVRGGKDGGGWPIGRDVYRSELYDIVEEIEGVECITRMFISGDKGAAPDRDENLLLPAPSDIATVYSGRHEISVLKEAEGCKGKKNV